MPRGSGTGDDEVWRPRPDRETSILFDVFVLGQRTRALVATAMRDAGLRPDEYAAYSVLFEAGAVTLTDLARRLGMPVTTAADYGRTMLGRGHLRKDRHPTDRRARLLALTASGARAHRRASRAFEDAYQSLAAELTMDEAAARQTLQALSNGADRALRSLQSGRADRTG
jgi:DNA-binding MarR family transcriptional regulator